MSCRHRRCGTRPRPRSRCRFASGLLGSRMIVCRHMPPAPGCHSDPVPWPRRPDSSCQVFPPSVRAEQRGVFHAGIDRVRIGQRRFEMPDPLELPRMLRAVVPLVRGQRFAGFRRRVVDELVAFALGHAVRGRGRFARGRAGLVPGFAAVVRALDDLAEPTAGLRRIDAIGIDAGTLEVVNLPAREMRPADIPFLALAVRSQNECAFACADQNSYSAHRFSFLL